MNYNIKKLIVTLTLLILTIGVTFAYLAARTGEGKQAGTTITADTVDDLKFNVSKENLSLNINQFNFASGSGNLSDNVTATASLKANSTKKTATYNYYVYFQIESNNYVYTTTDKKPEIVLSITGPNGEITSVDGLTYVSATNADGTVVKGFDITTIEPKLLKIADSFEISSSSSTNYTNQEWTVTVTFINLNTNQIDNENGSLNGKVLIQQEKMPETVADVCDSGDVLADCIVKAYNQIGNIIGLYYHNDEMVNGAKDNSYRFSGTSNFVKNYVCYGNSDDCYPGFRIIGLFNDNNHGVTGKNLVKVIQSDVSSEEAWRENNFKNSKANEILQNTYYPGLIEHYKDLIANVNWKTGGLSSSNLIAKSAFDEEITNSSDTYSAKVGLIYISDYAFATSPNNWTYSLNLYNKQQIYNSNWMLPSLMISGSSYAYSISIDKNNTGKVFSVYTDGNITTNDINNFGLLTPTFYLNSDVIYAGGSGTYSDPIKIS